MPALLIGTSGWVYSHWRGTFYPPELKESEWLGHYARYFDTVEINNSFYRLPPLATFESWREKAPPGFLFTVKASRYITHVKKLKDVEPAVENFFTNLAGLEDRCAAVLFQLPPRWKLNLERLERFLGALPGGYRFVFEFRDESWLQESVLDTLRSRGAALCFADSPFYPGPGVPTADFVFYRRHGGRGRGAPSYGASELAKLAVDVRGHLDEGRDVFCYFNNDFAGYAVKNALQLKKLMGQEENSHA